MANPRVGPGLRPKSVIQNLPSGPCVPIPGAFNVCYEMHSPMILKWQGLFTPGPHWIHTGKGRPPQSAIFFFFFFFSASALKSCLLSELFDMLWFDALRD